MKAEALREKRPERHLELQKKITHSDLYSPSSRTSQNLPTTLTNDATDSAVAGSGGISPLKFSVGGGDDPGEDMFSRVRRKQKSKP